MVSSTDNNFPGGGGFLLDFGSFRIESRFPFFFFFLLTLYNACMYVWMDGWMYTYIQLYTYA